MELTDRLKHASQDDVKRVIDRRDFLKAAVASGAGLAAVSYAGNAAASDLSQSSKRTLESLGCWKSMTPLVEDNFNDGVFDAAGNFTVFQGSMADSNESGGVLYLRGPNPGIDRFATQEFSGELIQIVDFNVVPMVGSEFYGIQMGQNNQDGFVRLIRENATGSIDFREKNAGILGSATYTATTNFSLKVVRDIDDNILAYVCQDFNPTDPIDNRVYQQLAGSSNISGAVSGGIIARYYGSEYQATRFLLLMPNPEEPPQVHVPVSGTIGLGVTAVALAAAGLHNLRQRTQDYSRK